MAMVPVAERMTAQEYLAQPVREDRRRVNLVEGEVIVNEPRWFHERHQENILFALSAWSRARPGRGRAALPLDIGLDERNVFAPDVIWYAEGRSPALHDDPPYPVPDIAVEVRSPSTWRYDIGAKKAAYERHGLPELWLIDTAADELLVFRRSGPAISTFDVSLELEREDTLTSPLLPGFALALAELFPPAG